MLILAVAILSLRLFLVLEGVFKDIWLREII